MALSQSIQIQLGVATLIGLAAYVLLFQVFRLVLRRIQAEFPLVILNCSRGPLLILIGWVGFRVFLGQLDSSEAVIWSTARAGTSGHLGGRDHRDPIGSCRSGRGEAGADLSVPRLDPGEKDLRVQPERGKVTWAT